MRVKENPPSESVESATGGLFDPSSAVLSAEYRGETVEPPRQAPAHPVMVDVHMTTHVPRTIHPDQVRPRRPCGTTVPHADDQGLGGGPRDVEVGTAADTRAPRQGGVFRPLPQEHHGPGWT
jgi:hypothetical protein